MLRLWLSCAGLTALALPSVVRAQVTTPDLIAVESGAGSLAVFLFGIAIIITVFLVRVWIGILNVSSVYSTQSLAAVERKHPYLPEPSVVVGTLLVTGSLVVLSADTFAEVLPLNALFKNSTLLHRVITIVLLLAAFGVFNRSQFHSRTEKHPYLFACAIGTMATWILIGFSYAFFSTDIKQDPFLMALGITCVVAGWRFLFGPWSPRVKATVLGTFIFWVTYTLVQDKSREDVVATVLAAGIAAIPVLLWMRLFLSYHKQKKSMVALAFFAGILSVAPILFYDALARRAVEFDFFLFKIIPQHFGASAETFVRESIFSSVTGVQSTVLVTLITFILVAVIEELSKFWVLRHSSETFFSSIDDAIQMAIVVALGFAFAENLINPNYFIGFIKDFLIAPQSPQWGPFLGNVFGRAVLTNMVHIVSTALLGYYFALAFFSSPVLKEDYARGDGHPVLMFLQRMMALDPKRTFEREHIAIGAIAAIGLHGAFNFIVSLPSVLPGNPTTVGQLMGSGDGSFLNGVSIILVPSILYVVGGCWLLTWLLMRARDLKDYGRKVTTETFVTVTEET